MPKFTYSAAKGIEQSSGSGFIVQNVPISRSIANSGSALTSASASFDDTEEVYYINVGAAHVMVIPNGGAVGEQKVIVIGTNGTGGEFDLTIGGVTLSTPADGSVHLLVWNGSAWKALS